MDVGAPLSATVAPAVMTVRVCVAVSMTGMIMMVMMVMSVTMIVVMMVVSVIMVVVMAVSKHLADPVKNRRDRQCREK